MPCCVLHCHQLEEHEEYDTIGGLIYTKVGRIPVEGEVIEVADGIEIEVKL